MQKEYFVYILASRPNGALYTGVTNNVWRRIEEHKDGLASKHTSKYKIFNLVYFETFNQIEDAIAREKQLKKWKRAWKVELIEKMNPDWRDLSRPI